MNQHRQVLHFVLLNVKDKSTWSRDHAGAQVVRENVLADGDTTCSLSQCHQATLPQSGDQFS